jgi:hypothetical protein
MLTCKPSRARSVIFQAPALSTSIRLSGWFVSRPVPHRPIVYQSLRAGESATGWRLDVGEGLSLVAPCCSILEAPNPARIQHFDQLLC